MYTGPVGWCDGAGLNFPFWAVLLIWIIAGHASTALAVGGCGRGCLDLFFFRLFEVVGWCDGTGYTSGAWASCYFG